MAARKKATQKKSESEQSTEDVYADYQPAAVPDRVEVRINGKIVYLDSLHGASVDVQASGVKVNGSTEPPKSAKRAAEQHFYNPEQDEPVAGGSQISPVPATDPELTEALDESATPDGEDTSEQ